MSGAKLPVTVIGGYLGTGKTTLVNRLLRAADGQRLAVLVNDFGTTPIDRDLIVSSNGDTLEISGGCICCSYGSDLMDTLMALPPAAAGHRARRASRPAASPCPAWWPAPSRFCCLIASTASW